MAMRLVSCIEGDLTFAGRDALDATVVATGAAGKFSLDIVENRSFDGFKDGQQADADAGDWGKVVGVLNKSFGK